MRLGLKPKMSNSIRRKGEIPIFPDPGSTKNLFLWIKSNIVVNIVKFYLKIENKPTKALFFHYHLLKPLNFHWKNELKLENAYFVHMFTENLWIH